MEMAVCDKEATKRLARVLVEFLTDLDTDGGGSVGSASDDEEEEEEEGDANKGGDSNEKGSDEEADAAKNPDKDAEAVKDPDKEGDASKHDVGFIGVVDDGGPVEETEPEPVSVETPTPPSLGSGRFAPSSPPSRSFSTPSADGSRGGGKSWKPAQAASVDDRTAAYQRSVATNNHNSTPSLKDRMAAYADASAQETQTPIKTPNRADPAIKQRMRQFQQKKVNAVQDRLAQFEPPPPTDGNERVKTLPSSAALSMRDRKKQFEGRKENAVQDRLSQFESAPSKSSDVVGRDGPSKIAQQRRKFSSHEKKENSLQDRAAMFQSPPPSAAARGSTAAPRTSSAPDANAGGIREKKELLKQRAASYQSSKASSVGNGSGTEEAGAGNNLKSRMAAFAEVSAADAFQKRKEEERKASIDGSSAGEVGAGSDLKSRMAAFAEVSAADAFQKQNDKKKKTAFKSNRFVVQAGRDKMQKRVSKFAEETSPIVTDRKKPLPRPKPSPGGDLQKRVLAFKEVSAADAFQKKKQEGESSGERVPVAGFQERMLAVEQGLARSQDADGSSPPAADGAPPPPQSLNPQEGGMNEKGQWKAYFGRVVENRATVRDAPKDYEYLYELCARLERLKAQENENPRFSGILGEDDAAEAGDASGDAGEGGLQSSLNEMLTRKTATISYTASADWVTEEWIRDHLVEDEKYGSLKFRFRDHTLFQQFDKTREKGRDKIIRTMVEKLLTHANDITQLDLSSCFLPDAFLQVLAEEVLKNPEDSLPNLQLLNFESNLIQGPGIEALSEVISDENAWKYLQAILLENQKHSMTNEAERALAEAVSLSHSIVVCSASIRCPYQLKDINDTLLYNNDQLRVARRDHQAKEGTLKERNRTEMELYFDSIAADESEDVEEVVIVGDQKFLTLEDAEKVRSGEAFATNTSVKTVKMELLGLGDDFAAAFGDAIAWNDTLERVSVDSNSITGAGMKALFAGLGRNSSIVEFQCRHQKKPMATLDEDALPDLLAPNTTLLKLGVDVRSKLVRLKLDRIVNANVDRIRKARARTKSQA